jgi:hypothetical protein
MSKLIVAGVIVFGFFMIPVLMSQTSNSLPWTMPGNFVQRLLISDLVVSGFVESTLPSEMRTINGIKIDPNITHFRVDRVFQGKPNDNFQFTWFSLHMDGTESTAYAGPPLASFQSGKRYLIFLKKEKTSWVVAIPMYELEAELAPELPPSSVSDFSKLLPEQRYEAIAEELERAALLVPDPPPGVTGEAAVYFPEIFDLIGACGEPFYRQFLSSPSHELRAAAFSWLDLIHARQMTCTAGFATLK